MADRTSAAICGKLFTALAKGDPEEDLVTLVWEIANDHDFSPYQMDCDEALIKLGLAKKGVRPAHPQDGEVVMYIGWDY